MRQRAMWRTLPGMTDGAIPRLTLGWRLQMALRHAGITSDEMAHELDVSRSTVSRWMHDRGRPRRIYVQEWALICGVSPEWLYSGFQPRAGDRRVSRQLDLQNEVRGADRRELCMV